MGGTAGAFAGGLGGTTGWWLGLVVAVARLSDTDLTLTAALRLPTFRAGGYERLKRLMLVVAPTREIKAVLYPITDIPAAIDWAFQTAT
ncbi:MAG: hypothetical protein QOH84_5821 [Kribbellaceae bacterium]|nr:hypothetical protein [Kribbellaceae bacterium]